MLSTTASRNASVYLVQERWEKYVRPEHADWTWRMLVGLYGEPTRHYHTLEHVAACLREADGLLAMQPTLDRDRMELALIWHDAVYVPGQKENERLSAELLNALRDVLTVRDRNTVEYACTTIVATAAHDADWYGSDALSAVLDIDMSILGQDEATYDAWRVGRGGFLAETLTRKKIYTLDVMRGRYEIRARENMRREAEGLAVP